MKIETGKYYEQMSFGITFTNYNHTFKPSLNYRSLIFDLGVWYIEIIFKNYE